MEQIIGNGWALLVMLCALVLTAIAAYKGKKGKGVVFGIEEWVTPLAYLAVNAFFAGIETINQPMVAVVNIGVCVLCGVLLLFPPPIESLRWYYPLIVTLVLNLFVF